MRYFIYKSVYVFLFCVFMTGCGSQMTIKQPLQQTVTQVHAKYKLKTDISESTKEAPEHFWAAVQGHVKSELSKRHLLAEPEDNAAQIANIVMTNYRMRSGFSRQFFGILAGEDKAEAEVTVLDAEGKVLGRSIVTSYNVMAIGNENDISRMLAEKIVMFLARENI